MTKIDKIKEYLKETEDHTIVLSFATEEGFMFYCFDKRNKDRHEEALKMLTIYLKSV
jgi:hypothetical protein